MMLLGDDDAFKVLMMFSSVFVGDEFCSFRN
jgi:hypothetical protein